MATKEIDVDADWEDARPEIFSRDAQSVRGNHFAAQNFADEAAEIRVIGDRLETDQIIVQQRIHQPLVFGNCGKHLGRRKWNVKEETDFVANAARAKFGAQRNQMIIMHPEKVAPVQIGRQDVGEASVNSPVSFRGLEREMREIEAIMINRP